MGPFRQGKPQVVPTPELDAYEKELRARTHRKVTYTGIAVILMVLPVMFLFGRVFLEDTFHKLTHPMRAVSPAVAEEARVAIARARAQASEEEARTRRGVDEAVSKRLSAHPELGRCPYVLSPSFTASPFATPSYRRTTDPTLCRSCNHLASAAEELERRIGEKSRDEDRDERARRAIDSLSSSRIDRYTAVLVVEKESAPFGTPHVDFHAGFVRGRAFVWDATAHEVVCVGDVYAENSEVVSYEYTTQNGFEVNGSSSLQRALTADLAKETERAVAQSLRYRAGPKIEDDE